MKKITFGFCVALAFTANSAVATNGLCLFDVDSTLTQNVDGDGNAAVIQKCLDKGFVPAIITGSGRDLRRICTSDGTALADYNRDLPDSERVPIMYMSNKFCKILNEVRDGGNYLYNSRDVVAGKTAGQDPTGKIAEILKRDSAYRKPSQARYLQKHFFPDVPDQCIIMFDNSSRYVDGFNSYNAGYRAPGVGGDALHNYKIYHTIASDSNKKLSASNVGKAIAALNCGGGTTTPTESSNKINVLTANLYINVKPTSLKGYHSAMDFSNRKPHILNVFNLNNPFLDWSPHGGEQLFKNAFGDRKRFDFIAIEEMTDSGHDVEHELRFNNQAIQCQYYKEVNSNNSFNCVNFHHGLDMLFDSNRWSYVSSERIDIGYDQKGDQPRYDRYAGVAVFQAKNDSSTRITAIAVHGPRHVTGKGSSEAKWEKLAGVINYYKKEKGTPVIMMGDFNVSVSQGSDFRQRIGDVVQSIKTPDGAEALGMSHKLCNPYHKSNSDPTCSRAGSEYSRKDGVFYTKGMGLTPVFGTPIFYPARYHGDTSHGFLSDHHFVFGQFELTAWSEHKLPSTCQLPKYPQISFDPHHKRTTIYWEGSSVDKGMKIYNWDGSQDITSKFKKVDSYSGPGNMWEHDDVKPYDHRVAYQLRCEGSDAKKTIEESKTYKSCPAPIVQTSNKSGLVTLTFVNHDGIGSTYEILNHDKTKTLAHKKAGGSFQEQVVSDVPVYTYNINRLCEVSGEDKDSITVSIHVDATK